MDKTSPNISVVMPCYNRAYVIQHAIRSVIDQTYKDFELIVVDDGSTDGTKRIVESFAHPRIIYKKIEHCGYISQVRNVGNHIAAGRIIVVHDSDDVALPDRLESIAEVFEAHPDAQVVYHGLYCRYFDPFHNAVSRAVKPALPFDKERLLREQYIPGQIAYRRECIIETPYDERIRACDDYQMLLEFALKGYKFVPLYKNLYEYCDSPDSINVNAEMDGGRKKDVGVILNILKTKYGINATAGLTKNTLGGQLISQEIVR